MKPSSVSSSPKTAVRRVELLSVVQLPGRQLPIPTSSRNRSSSAAATDVGVIPKCSPSLNRACGEPWAASTCTACIVVTSGSSRVMAM